MICAKANAMKITAAVRNIQNQDGGIVLDIRQGQMFRLNLVGSRILSLLQAGIDEPHIVVHISREFSTSIDTVRADVREFLDALEKRELLEQPSGDQI